MLREPGAGLYEQVAEVTYGAPATLVTPLGDFTVDTTLLPVDPSTHDD